MRLDSFQFMQCKEGITFTKSFNHINLGLIYDFIVFSDH